MQVINLEKTLTLFGNDKKLLSIGIDFYIELCHHLLFNLERSILDSDNDNLILFADGLKSASLVFGGETVVNLCEELLSAANDKEKSHHLVKKIDYECTKFIEELRFHKSHKLTA